MSDPKADRLAAIRAANAERRLGAAAVGAGAGAGADGPSSYAATSEEAVVAERLRDTSPLITHPAAEGEATRATVHAPPLTPAASGPTEPDATLSTGSVGLIALSAAGGALLAVTLPNLLPGLAASLLGPEPKVYWYLARSTAFVAYALLWLAMALGLMMTNRLARLWPGGPLAFDLHEHASILGLAFGLFHALILLGDRYMDYTFSQILVPFASGGAAAVWVGLGQVGLYLMGIVGLSFYLRPLIGRAGWRLIHFLSFVIFGLALLHGVMSGSDSGTAWAQALYWLSGGSLLFLTVYRVLVSATNPAPAHRTASPDTKPEGQTVKA